VERNEARRYSVDQSSATTRFEAALIVQEPGWLGPVTGRPPGVSHLASWYPLTTFALILVDVENAMNVTRSASRTGTPNGSYVP